MTGTTIDTTTLTRERADLIESLRRHRGFLRFTVRGLTDEQALLRPTVSALYLGGLIKHVAATEAGWVRFAEGGAEAMNRNWGPDVYMRHWHLQEGETLAGVLADYEGVAARAGGGAAAGRRGRRRGARARRGRGGPPHRPRPRPPPPWGAVFRAGPPLV